MLSWGRSYCFWPNKLKEVLWAPPVHPGVHPAKHLSRALAIGVSNCYIKRREKHLEQLQDKPGAPFAEGERAGTFPQTGGAGSERTRGPRPYLQRAVARALGTWGSLKPSFSSRCFWLQASGLGQPDHWGVAELLWALGFLFWGPGKPYLILKRWGELGIEFRNKISAQWTGEWSFSLFTKRDCSFWIQF
jgi:hypothetical protein